VAASRLKQAVSAAVGNVTVTAAAAAAVAVVVTVAMQTKLALFPSKQVRQHANRSRLLARPVIPAIVLSRLPFDRRSIGLAACACTTFSDYDES
jgi:hypothetical protein